MSRYGDSDHDENFPNEGALWRANAERALKGRRGRKVLAELREALLNLPTKRLISSALCTVNPAPRHRMKPGEDERMNGYRFADGLLDELVAEQGEGVCAVGAYLWWRKVKAGADPVEAFDSLPTLTEEDGGLENTAWLARQEASMVYSLAWDLAYRNDETFGALSPERRYQTFLDWIDNELGTAVGTVG